MVRIVPALQVCTAAAALFAVIGGCGLTPLSRGPRVRPRPRPPGVEVTVRSLTGYWVAVRETPEGRQTMILELVQNGNTLAGRLRFGARTLESDPRRPAYMGVAGEFMLGLGQPHKRVAVHGRPDPSGDLLLVTVRGLGPILNLTFTRP